MIKNLYPKTFNFLFIINIFFWDINSGIYQQKMLFVLLPLIYFFCKINLNNNNKNFFFEDSLTFPNYSQYFKFTIFLISFFFILLLHKLLFSIGSNSTETIKSIIKIFFIILIIFCIYFNFNILEKNFDKIIIYAIYLISILFFIEILINIRSGVFTSNYAYANNCYDDFLRKNSIIFMEGSHFGMVVPSLIIAYLLIIFEKSKNLIYYIPIIFLLYCTFAIALTLTFALSFIFGLVLCFLFYNNYKFKIISFLLIILTILNFISMPKCVIKFTVISTSIIEKIDNHFFNNIKKNYSDFALKVYVNAKNLKENEFKKNKIKIDDNENHNHNHNHNQNQFLNVNQMESSLSQAVYVNSFKVLIEAIKDNIFGYGIGEYKNIFFQHVAQTSKNITRDKDINKIVKILNTDDASNNFVKLSVELGVFSILIYLSLIIFLFIGKIDIKIKIFVLTIVVTQLFLRGAGYFNGGFMICLAIVFVTLFLKKDYEKKNL